MALNQEIFGFALSLEELEFLQRFGANDETLISLLKTVEAVPRRKAVVRLNRNQAEQVRASLTELLAKVGFEADYSLSKPGEMLEELIDRFCLP